MKRKEHLIISITLIFLISVNVGGNIVLGQEADINSKMYFSLEDSIETALKHNTNLKLEAEEYEMAKVERSEAKYASDKIQKIRDDRILEHFVPQVFTLILYFKKTN